MSNSLAIALVGAGATLLVPLATLVVYHDPRPLGWFAYHPPLMALGVVLLTLGIMPLQQRTPAERATQLPVHKNLLGAVAVPLLTAGVGAVAYNKHLKGAAHGVSAHAQLGWIVIAWLNVQALVGGLTVWEDGKLFGGAATAKKFYKYHRTSGYALLFTTLVVAFMGGMGSAWAASAPYPIARTAAFAGGVPLLAAGAALRMGKKGRKTKAL